MVLKGIIKMYNEKEKFNLFEYKAKTGFVGRTFGHNAAESYKFYYVMNHDCTDMAIPFYCVLVLALLPFAAICALIFCLGKSLFDAYKEGQKILSISTAKLVLKSTFTNFRDLLIKLA